MEYAYADHLFYTGPPVAALFGFKQIWDKSEPFNQTDCIALPQIGSLPPLPEPCRKSLLPHVFSNDSAGVPVYYQTDSDGTLAPATPAALIQTTSPRTLDFMGCAVQVNYVRYQVTTVENTMFNVVGGKKGTLHVLVARAGDPLEVTRMQHQCFQPMVDWIHYVVNDETPGSIGENLVAALGLATTAKGPSKK